MIHDAITHIQHGTAKTFEHLPSKFSFRAEGDGAFEQPIMDKFSTEAPALESLNDRKLRAFLNKEQALQGPENAGRSAEQGKKDMQKLAADSLGEGWTVKEFTAPAGGAPRIVSFELQDGGSSQEIYIDRYSRNHAIRVSSKTHLEGWRVHQNLIADLNPGAIDQDSAREEVFFAG